MELTNEEKHLIRTTILNKYRGLKDPTAEDRQKVSSELEKEYELYRQYKIKKEQE